MATFSRWFQGIGYPTTCSTTPEPEQHLSPHLCRFVGRLDGRSIAARTPHGWLHLSGLSRHNLHDVSVDVPLRVLTAVTGVSGSGKSTLVTQVLAEVVRCHLGLVSEERDEAQLEVDVQDASGVESFDRLVRVDQRPIGRTPRSNLATYTGMFGAVRKLYAATDEARARGYPAGRFSFSVPEGRCGTCQGEGFVAVELLFLPGTYAPCPTCQGARYNAETLEVTYRGKNIAEVLGLSADAAAKFLSAVSAASRSPETCARWDWGTCGWAGPRRNSAVVRRNASNWPPNCSEPAAGTRSTCSTSRRRGCTPRTSPCWCGSCAGSSTPPTRSSTSSTTWTRSPPPTGSSTSGRAVATRVGGWSRRAPDQGGESPPQRPRALSRGPARALIKAAQRGPLGTDQPTYALQLAAGALSP